MIFLFREEKLFVNIVVLNNEVVYSPKNAQNPANIKISPKNSLAKLDNSSLFSFGYRTRKRESLRRLLSHQPSAAAKPGVTPGTDGVAKDRQKRG